jgi:hypothetical protein
MNRVSRTVGAHTRTAVIEVRGERYPRSQPWILKGLFAHYGYRPIGQLL